MPPIPLDPEKQTFLSCPSLSLLPENKKVPHSAALEASRKIAAETADQARNPRISGKGELYIDDDLEKAFSTLPESRTRVQKIEQWHLAEGTQAGSQCTVCRQPIEPPFDLSGKMEIYQRSANRRRLAFRLTLSFAFIVVLLHILDPAYLRSFCSTNFNSISNAWRKHASSQAPAVSDANSERVPLEAHIMSKCPDARDCLRDLVVPAMEIIEDKVDFRLSFIGKTDPHNDGVICMHGQTECLGDLLELCAAKLYPQPKTYLGFTLCLSLSYPDIPSRELIESCALESGIDKTKLEACTAGQDKDDDRDDNDGDGDDDDDGHMAWGLLKKSFQRSADANVTTSCTVRLAGEVRCIRDGGEWKDCKGGSRVRDLVADVERLYGKKSGGEKKADV